VGKLAQCAGWPGIDLKMWWEAILEIGQTVHITLVMVRSVGLRGEHM